MNKRPVEVMIMGQKLKVMSDSEEAYVEEIAKHVDKKIKDVQSRTKSVVSMQVAILAAMNIMDEYFKYKQRCREKNESVARKIEQVIEHIDLQL